MRRVCIVVTARPSYSRIKSVLAALQETDAEVHIVAAASALVVRYGRIVDQIRADGLWDHLHEVSCVLEGGTVRESAIGTGVFLTQLSGVLEAIDPDVVVTIADRHETLATAIAASYQNIPLCHIQGGEVSGSIDDKVRNAVTQLSGIHCVSTVKAEANVQRMRPDADIHRTGCPSLDLAAEAKRIGPLPGPDVVVLQHPVTTEDGMAGWQMEQTVTALKPFGDRVLWFWPGEDAGADDMSKVLRMAGLKPKRNLPGMEFLRTLLGARVLVGNSSVGIRECSFLGVPVVNIGSRQRGRERGPNVTDVPYDHARIREAVYGWMDSNPHPSTLYGDGKAGERIAAILTGALA